MKITLEVTTRSEKNGLTSRLVDKTWNDVRSEFSGNFVAKMKSAKFQDNCQNKTLTEVRTDFAVEGGGGGENFKFV
jgi:hypothetical protein